MTLILHIETAVETASICLAKDGELLALDSNTQQRDHAAWIHNAMHLLMDKAGFSMKELSAIAVSAGPGSYTGLRVGMASAKGLSYALQIPMNSLNTLEIMANAAITNWSNKEKFEHHLFVPMIDARRMEVFTAIYDPQLKNMLPPQAMVIDKDSFNNWLNDHLLIFFGNGNEKCRNLISHQNALFEDISFSASNMITLAHINYQAKNFADLAYSEPFYTKGFYSPAKKI